VQNGFAAPSVDLPAAQAAQAAAPAANPLAGSKPGGHSSGAPLGQKKPSGQGTHWVEAMVPSDKVVKPGLHAKQIVCVAALFHRPSGHGRQPDMLQAVAYAENLPGGQPPCKPGE
jgi:hypothetical protein